MGTSLHGFTKKIKVVHAAGYLLYIGTNLIITSYPRWYLMRLLTGHKLVSSFTKCMVAQFMACKCIIFPLMD